MASVPGSAPAAATASSSAPAGATAAVLVTSERMADDAVRVRGYDFNAGVDHSALFTTFLQTGFQATNLALAIDQVRKMVRRSGRAREGESEREREREREREGGRRQEGGRVNRVNVRRE